MPPQVETALPPLSTTMTSPARAASIMWPTRKSEAGKVPRTPVIWRTVTAGPTQRKPGATDLM